MLFFTTISISVGCKIHKENIVTFEKIWAAFASFLHEKSITFLKYYNHFRNNVISKCDLKHVIPIWQADRL